MIDRSVGNKTMKLMNTRINKQNCTYGLAVLQTPESFQLHLFALHRLANVITTIFPFIQNSDTTCNGLLRRTIGLQDLLCLGLPIPFLT